MFRLLRFGLGSPALLGLVMLWLCAGVVQAAETLQLRASYQGIFSLGQNIPVADIRLDTFQPGNAAYVESRLQASSAAYGFVEALYPIRYRMKSWYTRDRSRVIASEYFEGHPDQADKQQLLMPEKSDPGFSVQDLSPQHQSLLPALDAGTYVPPPGSPVIFDRLGLLQKVRAEPLKVGDVLQIPVSNGRQRLTYRVEVEKRDTLTLAGHTWRALKLRFDGSFIDSHGRKEAAHRPVYVWLSDDARHLPLRGVIRNDFGRINIELISADTGSTDPVAAPDKSGAGAQPPAGPAHGK